MAPPPPPPLTEGMVLVFELKDERNGKRVVEVNNKARLTFTWDAPRCYKYLVSSHPKPQHLLRAPPPSAPQRDNRHIPQPFFVAEAVPTSTFLGVRIGRLSRCRSLFRRVAFSLKFHFRFTSAERLHGWKVSRWASAPPASQPSCRPSF